MRIISGTRRGARIVAPKGVATRPTGDRVLVMVRPEVYVERAPQYADTDGNLIDEKIRDGARRYVIALAAWARRVER